MAQNKKIPPSWGGKVPNLGDLTANQKKLFDLLLRK